MVFKFFAWTSRFYSFCNLSKVQKMNHNKCYFRYVEREGKIDISFLYKVKDSARQFNLSRNPTESLATLITRMGTNVQKIVSKKTKKKGKKEEVPVEVQIFDSNNVPLSEHMACKELFDLEQPVRLKIHDHMFEAVFNAPWVISINLPHSILAGFPVYPDHFEIQHANIENCVFNWYKGSTVNEKGNLVYEQHVQWELIGSGYNYKPRVEDVGMKLKLECIPGNKTDIGPAVEAISKSVVEAGPGHCSFETRHLFTSTKLGDRSFRCVSYNILADLYCDSEVTRTVLHPYCPPYALHIDYRKQLIIKELMGYNADILCLQEVDTKIFNHCLKGLLKTSGLEGLFFRKGKEVAEGLACFYRKDRFSYIGEEKIFLTDILPKATYLEEIWEAVNKNHPLKERLLDRSTVASATFLQSNDSPNDILLVGNTHLYFHPDADHIRLIQGGIVIYWLNYLKKQLQSKFSGKRISLILCGDFNSVPSCGIFQLYTTGLAGTDLPDWNSNVNEAVNNLILKQTTSLGSACGTPQFTNFTAGFADCLDYIFYEKFNLEVEQVIPFPSEGELRVHTALPSIVFPSDHIALVADLRFVIKD